MNLEDLIVKALLEAKDSEESLAERMDGQENISYIVEAGSFTAVAKNLELAKKYAVGIEEVIGRPAEIKTAPYLLSDDAVASSVLAGMLTQALFD